MGDQERLHGVDTQKMTLEMSGSDHHEDKEGNYIPIEGDYKQSCRGIKESGVWDRGQ